MRETVHRHLGKLLTATALAAAGTAAMVAITLPGTAGANTPAGTRTAEGADAVPPGVYAKAPAEGATGTGRDPLTDDEIRRVEKTALNQPPLRRAENVAGTRGAPQPLAVDLADPKAGDVDDPNAPRRADATFYDYDGDALITETVDLTTGRIEHTSTRHGVQPPLSRAENTEAARLLIADPLGAGLRADYKDATGHELTSPDQLLLDSAVYRATPGSRPAALDACGEHRCVRLFPKVRNGPWIDARSLVVDLSARTVGRLGRR